MRKIILLICMAFIISIGYCQEEGKDKRPYYFKGVMQNWKHAKYRVVLAEKKLDTIHDERYAGELIKVDLDLNESNHWIEIDNNRKLFRYEVEADFGYDIYVNFDVVGMPKENELYVFSPDGFYSEGFLNKKDMKSYKMIKSGLIKGRKCMIELIVPRDSSCNVILKSIGVVVRKGFVEEVNKNLGDAGSCHNNVMCTEFTEWCNERRSVARILIESPCGTLSWCSGTLLENEKRDGKPYFLTAFHCMDCNNDQTLSQAEKDAVDDWQFHFNYQSLNCSNPLFEPSYQVLHGATFKAAYDETDFALMELNERPSSNFNSYYSGWTNDESKMSATGVVIHHPSGDIKKISKYNKLYSSDTDFWKVEYTDGSTEGGSSGSALITNEHYVVGQLKEGTAECGYNGYDKFGDFCHSWKDGGSADKNLKDWLSPNSTNLSYISAMSGSETCKINWYFTNASDLHTSANIDGKNNPISSGTRMYDGVYNATNNITAENNVLIKSGTDVSFQAGNSINLGFNFKIENGASFKAEIKNCERGCGNQKSISEDNVVENETVITNISGDDKWKVDDNKLVVEGVSVFPNPSHNNLKINAIGVGFIHDIQIVDLFGKIVFCKSNLYSQESMVNVKQLNNGVYFIKITLEGGEVYTEKLIKN